MPFLRLPWQDQTYFLLIMKQTTFTSSHKNPIIFIIRLKMWFSSTAFKLDLSKIDLLCPRFSSHQLFAINYNALLMRTSLPFQVTGTESRGILTSCFSESITGQAHTASILHPHSMICQRYFTRHPSCGDIWSNSDP